MSVGHGYRRDDDETGGPVGPARESFTSVVKRRVRMNDDELDANPAITQMEKIADRLIRRATSDERSAMAAAKVVISYTDGKPAQTINNVFRGDGERRVDPEKQRMLINDPVYREHILAIEERRAAIDSGDVVAEDDAIDVDFEEE